VDLYPVISNRSLEGDWDYKNSIQSARQAAVSVRDKAGEFAAIAWQAYQQVEHRPGGRNRAFSFRGWCEDVNVPRRTVLDIIRRFDPALDQKLRDGRREKIEAKRANEGLIPEKIEEAEVVSVQSAEDKDAPKSGEPLSLPPVGVDDDVWSMLSPLSDGIARTSSRLKTFYGKCQPVMELADMLDRIDKKLLHTWKEKSRGPCPKCQGLGDCGQGDGTCGRHS
jgi:hypothetical protein